MAKIKERYDLIAIIFSLIILVFALGVGSFREVGTFGVESDFYEAYAIQAENILAGKAYTYQHNPPGYCLLLAAVTFGVGNTFVAGKIISAFALALLSWITYLLLKSLVSDHLALITSILTSLTLFPASFLAATDVVSTLAIFLPLWLFLSPLQLTPKICLFAGIFAGIAYLLRSNGIFVNIGLLLSIILINFNQESIEKRLIKIAFLLSGFALVISPWLFYNWQINGSSFASTTYLQVAANFYHPQGDNLITSVRSMQTQFHSLIDVILYNPLYFLHKYMQDVLFLNIPKLFIPKALLESLKFPIYQIAIAFPIFWILVGFIDILRDLNNSSKSLHFQKFMAFTLVQILGYLMLGLVGFHRRYYFFFFPFIFLLMIYPLIKRNFKVRIYFVKLPLTRFLMINLIVLIMAGACIETKLTLESEPKYLLTIADFLKHYTLPHETIIIRKPHLAYLAHLKAEFPLAQTAEDYLAKAQEINAKYIAYSDYEAQLWLGLKSLSNPQLLPFNFKLIYHHLLTHTLIYKIVSR